MVDVMRCWMMDFTESLELNLLVCLFALVEHHFL